MATLKLHIRMDNAAFDLGNRNNEVARILRAYVFDLEDAGEDPGALQDMFYDINGHFVGDSEVVEDEE